MRVILPILFDDPPCGVATRKRRSGIESGLQYDGAVWINGQGANSMTSRLEALCLEKGLKMTDQRRVISQVLSEADDHPDVEEVHRRAVLIDPRISIATVYRTMRLL